MTPEHALRSGDPEALNQLLQPIFDTKAYDEAKKEGRLMAVGLPAVLVQLLVLSCSRQPRQRS